MLRKLPTVFTPILTLFALLACSLTAGAQSERKAIDAFKKAFLPKVETPNAQRLAGMTAIRGMDSKAIAEALVTAHRAVDAELATIEQDRLAAQEEYRELIKGQENSRERTLPSQEKLDRFKELAVIQVALREKADGIREVLDAVRARIGELRSDKAHAFLVKKVLAGKKEALPLRLAAARALAKGGAGRVPDLVKALKRAKRVLERLAIVDALQEIGVAASPAMDELLGLLTDDEEAVRERAALALASLKRPEPIVPLIDLLEREEGMVRKRIAAALEILTRQEHGDSVGAWRAWYEAEGMSLTAKDLGGGRPSAAKDFDKGAYYFGLPQDGKGIVYIIDASDSMKKMIKMDTKGKTAGGGKVPETTRLEACKKELIRALGKLTPGRKFNVVWYNDLPHIWKPAMMKAAPGSITSAQDWVRKLDHSSTTNIHDALQMAFSQVGRGAHDKAYGVEMDTIFLLTDGSPTLPNSQPDSTEKILNSVRQWNPLKRITIHTIGIGRELNAGFLQQLASENNGQFKRYM